MCIVSRSLIGCCCTAHGLVGYSGMSLRLTSARPVRGQQTRFGGLKCDC
ncbi:putative nanos RNA binding domain, partial [Fasciola gigantica]